MADTTFTIRVDEARGSVRITYRSTGRVAGLLTAGLTGDLLQQATPSKASAAAWWEGVIDLVRADLVAQAAGVTA